MLTGQLGFCILRLGVINDKKQPLITSVVGHSIVNNDKDRGYKCEVPFNHMILCKWKKIFRVKKKESCFLFERKTFFIFYVLKL